MKLNAWLRQAVKELRTAGIGTARLDALVLLEDVTSKDRAWLLAHPEFELSQAQATKIKKLLRRRASHEPLAYIRGKIEFYGREFVLTSAVLQPRPESETMIDLLKKLIKGDIKVNGLSREPRLADVGAGSGALGIAARLELKNVSVDLLELDPKAIKVAQTNVDKFTLNVSVIESDLLLQSKQDYDILLCNLPYVPDDFKINEAALQEPKIAIFGGSDGLDVYRRLFDQIKKLHKKPLYILTESLPTQHPTLTSIAQTAEYQLMETDDFIQTFAKS